MKSPFTNQGYEALFLHSVGIWPYVPNGIYIPFVKTLATDVNAIRYISFKLPEKHTIAKQKPE